jgi:hypothetical protein
VEAGEEASAPEVLVEGAVRVVHEARPEALTPPGGGGLAHLASGGLLGCFVCGQRIQLPSMGTKQWGKWERGSEKSGGARAIFGDN